MKQPKKTAARIERDKRNALIRKERADLLSVEGAMPTAVDEYLANKYGLCRVSIYKICNQ